ncbi:hypothetical protein HDV06_003429 [Boothiomyces sp. JEL0866]|nr:hypothetical protein HDV06_003381 [Boothiomyces sp. JEL0866]KAJ3325659.1 hypothetical protein HDV06_003429 [Boothiomyces sp. JEL0866]
MQLTQFVFPQIWNSWSNAYLTTTLNPSNPTPTLFHSAFEDNSPVLIGMMEAFRFGTIFRGFLKNNRISIGTPDGRMLLNYKMKFPYHETVVYSGLDEASSFAIIQNIEYTNGDRTIAYKVSFYDIKHNPIPLFCFGCTQGTGMLIFLGDHTNGVLVGRMRQYQGLEICAGMDPVLILLIVHLYYHTVRIRMSN